MGRDTGEGRRNQQHQEESDRVAETTPRAAGDPSAAAVLPTFFGGSSEADKRWGSWTGPLWASSSAEEQQQQRQQSQQGVFEGSAEESSDSGPAAGINLSTPPRRRPRPRPKPSTPTTSTQARQRPPSRSPPPSPLPLPPPPPPPPYIEAQPALAFPAAVRETRSDGALSVESPAYSFQVADGLLFPTSTTRREGRLAFHGSGHAGGADDRGLLRLADEDNVSAADLAADGPVDAGDSPIRLEESPTNDWMMSRTARLLSVVAFWLTHTCSVYATKALLARPGRTIRIIVLITWCQCLASFTLVLSLGTLGARQDRKSGGWTSGFLVEMARALPQNALLGGWNSKSLLGGGAEAVGLASVLFCLAVFADNACLGAVNASFFQVARALTLPFVTIMGAVGTRSFPPRDLLLPCALCVVGFCLGVRSQTPEAFADGTSMGVMASLLTAAYTLLLARAEPREAWRVTYVTNRNASVILVPVAVYVGMGDPTDLAGESFLLKDRTTILLAILATILPALAGVCTMWQAQARLGARGLAASSVGRAAFSHLLAFRVFGNSKVLVGEIGCCLVLTGLALYASCRGGAAVAQAGNVAVPGAAREHFVPSSSVVLSCPSPVSAGTAVGLQVNRVRKDVTTSSLLRRERVLLDEDGRGDGGDGDDRSTDYVAAEEETSGTDAMVQAKAGGGVELPPQEGVFSAGGRGTVSISNSAVADVANTTPGSAKEGWARNDTGLARGTSAAVSAAAVAREPGSRREVRGRGRLI